MLPRPLLAVALATGLAHAQQHWAFVAPVRPAVPVVSDGGWAKNDVDRFVLARLRREGLTPSAAATRGELLRRVTFDVTGLPPTIAELEQFEHDARPDAYERLVDRLLASPAAAEEQTRIWLDLARYADTHGMERDQVRALWRWRDHVLDAFATDMPFDRFVTEQLAGDLLPDATLAQRVMSGFNRCNPSSDEGGLIPEEYLARYAMDRVETFGTALLGMTVGCAQCHDHKYDPLTQRDYYRLFAWFASFDENGNDGGGLAPKPAVMAPDDAQLRELAQRRAAVAARTVPSEGWNELACSDASSDAGTLTRLPDGSLRADGPVPERGTYTLRCDGAFGGLRTLRLLALCDDALPERGPGRADNGNLVLTEVVLQCDGAARPFARAEATFAQPGHDAARAIDGDAATGWAMQGNHATTPLYVELTAPLPDGATTLTIELRHDSVHRQHLLGRFAIAWSPEPIDALREREHAALLPRAEAERALAGFERSLPLCMVSGDLATPREVHVLLRGRYDQPGERVEPGTPAFLPPLPAGAPRDRRALAAWLFAEGHPLTARVVANRIWQQHFGRGLVATPHDFGTRGAAPSHPELLDWLACELREHGWSQRWLHQLLLTSATYRQSARCDDARRSRDPANVWLSRMPRVRLPAEAIRDQALAVAGLLVDERGGPSVRIPQPPGIWEAVAFPGSNTEHYVADTGAAIHRRSVYTFWKRTAPPPLLTTLDAPSREQCVVERQVTTTPLQVLALWNDEGMREAARAFGERVRAAASDDDARVAFAFRTLLQRAPDDDEVAACRALLQQDHGCALLATTLFSLDESHHRN
ncbi:MAG: DUF1553 domain-containing protein [Planctomycetes bacterium]|nr:DUF1553 domain-containing protein [Planctomycetota bacterium]